jgi:hypothetical protein
MAWDKTKLASTTDRGYGHQHQQVRKALLPQAYGTPCVRCGYTMLPGQVLHLDHNSTRTGYLGFAHAKCNVTAAARKARAKQTIVKQRRVAARW